MNSSQQLKRVVGLPGAVTLGLGSILGTGVFVSLLFAVQLAGEWAILSVAFAAALAVCNGLSSAQLAASHPVSGGAYEYGYRYLTPTLGFNAGWMFLIAKGASAATASLAFAECLRQIVPAIEHIDLRVSAGLTLAVVTVLVLSGVRRSVRVNTVIVTIVLVTLGVFSAAALTTSNWQIRLNTAEFTLNDVLRATALCFVAYTGYGRVATMGEEISEPSKNIPRAVIATLVITSFVYLLVTVAIVAIINSSDSHRFLQTSKSLDSLLAVSSSSRLTTAIVGFGAMLAMFGVLLNLVLGLSRVVLAMARRQDLPSYFAGLSPDGDSPQRAVVLVAVMIGVLALSGDVLRTWSMSAFAVLIYYATANLCALRQPAEERRYPRVIPMAGLCGCLGLAPFIDLKTIVGGVVLLVVGLLVKVLANTRQRKSPVA
ncbi:MAG: amino acid permease [Rhodopirellula sp.]|nr:amino acid permease [Rhodopirellula sp.]